MRNCQEKAVNCVNRGVKASFTLDLPDLKFFLFLFFVSHVSKNMPIILACCYTCIPSLDAFGGIFAFGGPLLSRFYAILNQLFPYLELLQ